MQWGVKGPFLHLGGLATEIIEVLIIAGILLGHLQVTRDLNWWLFRLLVFALRFAAFGF